MKKRSKFSASRPHCRGEESTERDMERERERRREDGMSSVFRGEVWRKKRTTNKQTNREKKEKYN